MNKRGQAALEFLMTYGWAILVVMVIIGALAYFGVLNPMMFVPERCTMSVGFNCDSAYIIDSGADEVRLRLENNFGRDVTVTEFNVTYDVGEYEILCETPDLAGGDRAFNTGQIWNVVFDCDPAGDLEPQQGRKIRMDIAMRFYPTGTGPTYASSATGSLLATVQ